MGPDPMTRIDSRSVRFGIDFLFLFLALPGNITLNGGGYCESLLPGMGSFSKVEAVAASSGKSRFFESGGSITKQKVRSRMAECQSSLRIANRSAVAWWKQRMRWLFGKIVLLLIVGIGIGGCAEGYQYQRSDWLDAIAVSIPSPPYILKDFSLWKRLADAKTFGVQLSSSMHPIAAKHVAFFVRCLLEQKGYRYVEPPQQPDFWVSAKADDVADGFFAQLDIWDPSGTEILWTGIHRGRRLFVRDARIYTQLLFLELLRYIPWVKTSGSNLRGGIGIEARILTLDGNRYFPVVIKLLKGTPAMKVLNKGDIIVAIDGVSVENQPWSKVKQLLEGKPGTEVEVTVLRQLVAPVRRWDFPVEDDNSNAVRYGGFRFLRKQFRIKRVVLLDE